VVSVVGVSVLGGPRCANITVILLVARRGC